MSAGLTIVVASVIGLGLITSAVLTLHVWECRRYARKRLSMPIFRIPDHLRRVTLFAPCKGRDLDLERNLQALFCQDYDNYEVVFIVEQAQDEAVPVIRRVAARYTHITSHLVVAGLAAKTGQKVHNLQVATGLHGRESDVLAFVDSDAQPRAEWLRMLVARLAESTSSVGAVTGYRWFMPERDTMSNLFLYVANRSAAGALGGHRLNLVWGGSWAIQRKVFDECSIREAWEGTLSDDLMVTRVLRRHGLHAVYAPKCLAASPIDMNWGQAVEFLRRQYFMGRHYAAGHWWLALLVTLSTQLALWTSLACGLWLSTFRPSGWAWLAWWTAATAYGLTVYRGWMREDVAARRFAGLPRPSRSAGWARLVSLFCGPFFGPLICLCQLGSSFSRCVTWRGVRYWMGAEGRIGRVEHLRGDRGQTADEQGAPQSLVLNQAPSPIVADAHRTVRTQAA
jgi:ceramide glucosyltransferase